MIGAGKKRTKNCRYDGTEIGMANELADMGIPKDDIVLGFQAPYKRPYTGFASE